MLDVSIIIPCYNGAIYIPSVKGVVDSYISQGAEIIFINDGSKDHSLKLLKEEFPKQKILDQPNRGLAASRNAGAYAATKKYLQFLDIDDRIHPDKLLAQLNFAEEKKLDVVYSDWQMVIVNQGEKKYEEIKPSGFQEDILFSLINGWWQPIHSYLISRKAYLKIKGSDENLINAQDFDLMARLAIEQYSFGYLPGTHSYYFRFVEIKSLARSSKAKYWRSYHNALTKLYQLSIDKGLVKEKLQKAFANRWFDIARNVYKFNRKWNEEIMAEIKIIYPEFFPKKESFFFKTTFLLFGYYNAELFSRNLHHIKNIRRS